MCMYSVWNILTCLNQLDGEGEFSQSSFNLPFLLGGGGDTQFCYLVLTIVRALTCIVPVLYIGVMGWPLILYADDMCLYMFLPQKCSGGLGKAAKKTVVRYTETSNTMGTK